MIINVTRRDILLGHNAMTWSCPIARAIGRHKPFINVRVFQNHAYAEIKNTKYKCWLPIEAERFIVRFDSLRSASDRAKLQPFSFDVTFTKYQLKD